MASRQRKHTRKSAPLRTTSRLAKPAKAGGATRAEPAPRIAPTANAAGRKRAMPDVEVGLREKPPGRPEQTRAFFLDARHATDELAEELGESFVLSATSGEDPEEYYQSERPEEEGGPFLETSGHIEFAHGVDESNPEDAEPAPWPAVSPGQPPPHRSGGPR